MKKPDEISGKKINLENAPDIIKKSLLDEHGHPNKLVKKFILFYDALKNSFNAHFSNMVSTCIFDETWEILKNPRPFVNKVCLSFKEDFQNNFLSSLSEEQQETMNKLMPNELLPLVHKMYAINAMTSLSYGISNLTSEDRILYYRMFSGDSFIDEETAEQKIIELIEEFYKELNKIYNETQDEWQDRTLDAYNKKMLSREFMEYIMSQTNKRKINI